MYSTRLLSLFIDTLNDEKRLIQAVTFDIPSFLLFSVSFFNTNNNNTMISMEP